MSVEKNHFQDQKIEEIKVHIAKINDEMSSIWKEISNIRIEITNIRTNLNWMLKTYWIIVTASIGAIIITFYNLILK